MNRTPKNTLLAIFLSIPLLFISCKKEKKTAYVFQITGDLTNLATQNINLQTKDSTDLLRATQKQGKFYITSTKKFPLDVYYIQIDTFQNRIPVLIDNTNIVLHLNSGDLSQSYTQGKSDFQKIYTRYTQGKEKAKTRFAFQKKYVEENRTTMLGAIFLKEMLGKTTWRLEQTQSLYNTLTVPVQKSDIGTAIQVYLQDGFSQLKKEVTVKEPKPKISKSTETRIAKPKPIAHKAVTTTEYAPYFYAMGTQDTDISAQQIFAGNKLTLIDFWASWCMPCRAQTPDLVRLYQTYHQKGFEILSVSEDKQQSNWKNAIAQDRMHWTHVIDDYKRVANMYHVKTIPYAILVDNQGGIIEKHIGINRLESALKNLLK